MNILLISPLPPPEGGIATWTVKYQTYCDEHQIPLSIVNNALLGARAKKINAQRRLTDELKRTVHVLRQLSIQINEKKQDIVHLNTSCSRFGIFRDLLCVRFASSKNIPIVLHCRCNIEDQIRGKLANCAFIYMAKKASRILTLNQRSYRYASQYAPGKVTTMPNFIENTYATDDMRIRERVQQVLYVGHVQESKGSREIIQAAAKLPDMRFVMIGPVQSSISTSDCPPNMSFLGNLKHEEVIERMREADVFLFPSYTEGFANALVEAMACGLPVVTTDVGANREMIEDQGGVIVPVADSQAIIDALTELSNDIDSRRAMAEWNVAKVRRCYLQEAVMSKLMEVYGEVLT